jgi:hypothetical protein
VWSQLSKSPPSPSTTNCCAARNTWGSARRKAVNALLGVAHNEHAGRLPVPCARVARQPWRSGLPLQGVGVLEFINQQMAHARIQPLLHPAAEHGSDSITRAARSTSFMSTQLRSRLSWLKACNQQPGQARHALLVQPGRVLIGRGQQACASAWASRTGNAHHFFAEFAGLALLGEQRVQHACSVVGGERELQCCPWPRRSARWLGPALAASSSRVLRMASSPEGVIGLRHAGKVGN